MERPLTGRTVFLITASAFAVIIAVNVTMAVQAVRTFPGLEVKSSYVASQTFDAERKAQEALGWHLAYAYDGAELRLDISDAAGRPVEAALTARVGRATEAADDADLSFSRRMGAYVAPLSLAPGKWVVFLDARAADGTPYRKRLELSVRGEG